MRRGVFSSFRQLSRDAKLLIVMFGIVSVGYFGILMLLRSLYILRLGYGPEYIGLYGTVSAVAFASMCLPGGALSAKFGVRRVMRASGAVMVLGMALLPMSQYVPAALRFYWPLLAQTVSMLGWATLQVNMGPALMAATTAERRSTAFAIYNAIYALGIFAGMLVGGMLPGAFGSLLGQELTEPAPYSLAIWVGAAVVACIAFPLSTISRLHVAPHEAAARSSEDAERFPWAPVMIVLLQVCLTRAAWATCQSFCDAYLDSVLRLPTASIGVLSSVGQLAAIVSPLIGPRLAISKGSIWVLMAGSLGLGASMLPIALIPHWGAAGLSRLGVLVLTGIWVPAVQVYLMELVPPRWRTLAFGASSMSFSVAYGASSYFGGRIIAAEGYNRAFLIAALIPLAGALLMWIARRIPALQPRTG